MFDTADWQKSTTFATRHCRLSSWKGFMILSIDSIVSSFTGTMVIPIRYAPPRFLGLPDLSRLLLVIVLRIRITRLFHIFLNTEIFHDIFLCKACRNIP